MSDKDIFVLQKSAGDPLRFDVVVRENGSETEYEVTLGARDLARLGEGQGGSQLVSAAFAFLLEREPKESILRSFDLSVISRYFPEFERELPRYLKSEP
jgi:hypothetical protein